MLQGCTREPTGIRYESERAHTQSLINDLNAQMHRMYRSGDRAKVAVVYTDSLTPPVFILLEGTR